MIDLMLTTFDNDIHKSANARVAGKGQIALSPCARVRVDRGSCVWLLTPVIVFQDTMERGALKRHVLKVA